jgi:hypothetical protein
MSRDHRTTGNVIVAIRMTDTTIIGEKIRENRTLSASEATASSASSNAMPMAVTGSGTGTVVALAKIDAAAPTATAMSNGETAPARGVVHTC